MVGDRVLVKSDVTDIPEFLHLEICSSLLVYNL